MNKLSTKIWVWHGVVVILAWVFWASSAGLKFNSITGFDVQVPSFVWFLWVTAVVGLGYILFHGRWWPASISVIVGVLFLFYLGFTVLNLTAVVIFWLFNVWAHERGIHEMRERKVINMMRTLVATLFPVVLGFFVLGSFAAYQSTFAQQIQDANQLPAQSLVLIRSIVDNAFGTKLGPSNSIQHQQALNEVSTGAFKAINDFLRPYFKWTPPAVAFGLFIILWGLSWFFVYAATLGGLIIYWVLKKAKVLKIEEKDVKAEVLVI